MQIIDSVTGCTKVLGVIGNPIEHTFSPQLHNTISRHLGTDFIYVPFKVEKDELCSAVAGLKALNVAGFNVTIPYKKEVMKYIDENSREALLMGAVNTVKNIGGRLYGYNTDAEGFARSFKEEAGTDFRDKKVAVLGAGGAARAIAAKTALEGAECIYILNRTPEKAHEIAELINNNIRKAARAYDIADESAADVFKKCDIIINTIPVGMYPDTESIPIPDCYSFSCGQVVYDAIYNPPRTRFLAMAEAQGCKVVNGLGMLFYQGIFAYEIWTGIKLPSEFIREAYLTFLTILEK